MTLWIQDGDVCVASIELKEPTIKGASAMKEAEEFVVGLAGQIQNGALALSWLAWRARCATLGELQ